MWPFRKSTKPADAPAQPTNAILAGPLQINLTGQPAIDHALYRLGAIERHIGERAITLLRQAEYRFEALPMIAALEVAGAITEARGAEIKAIIANAEIRKD